MRFEIATHERGAKLAAIRHSRQCLSDIHGAQRELERNFAQQSELVRRQRPTARRASTARLGRNYIGKFRMLIRHWGTMVMVALAGEPTW
jgi:hypothetical protein